MATGDPVKKVYDPGPHRYNNIPEKKPEPNKDENILGGPPDGPSGTFIKISKKIKKFIFDLFTSAT